MNKKQYEECFERLDKYVFSRDMAVKEDWYDLLNYHHNQLQSYKDKEDRLREYCKSNRGYVQGYGFVYREDEKLQEVKNDILEILGE